MTYSNDPKKLQKVIKTRNKIDIILVIVLAFLIFRKKDETKKINSEGV